MKQTLRNHIAEMAKGLGLLLAFVVVCPLLAIGAIFLVAPLIDRISYLETPMLVKAALGGLAVVAAFVTVLAVPAGALAAAARLRQELAAPTPSFANVLEQFAHSARNDARTASLLFLVSGAIVGVVSTYKRASIAPLLVFAVIVAFVQIRYVVTIVRIRLGVFGTNQREARELLRFIFKHVPSGSFTGGLGARDIHDLELVLLPQLAPLQAREPQV